MSTCSLRPSLPLLLHQKKASLFMQESVKCTKCKCIPTSYVPRVPGKVTTHGVYLSCDNLGCVENGKQWFACLSCFSRLSTRKYRIDSHFDSLTGCRLVELCSMNSECDDLIEVSNIAHTAPIPGLFVQHQFANAYSFDSISPNIQACLFFNQNSHEYFARELEIPQSGMRYILKKSLRIPEGKLITTFELLFQYRLCSYMLQQKRSNLHEFSEILHTIVSGLSRRNLSSNVGCLDLKENIVGKFMDSFTMLTAHNSQQACLHDVLKESLSSIIETEICGTKDCVDSNPKMFASTTIPTDYNCIRRCYLGGKNSILNQLPTPETRMTDDQLHTYVDIKQIVATYLAMGSHNYHSGVSFADSFFPSNTFSQMYPDTQPSAIPSGQRVNPLNLFVKDWSDDFDKNNSVRNKSSIWMKTMSFLNPSGKANADTHTYIVGIGSKGQCHDEVEDCYRCDLNILRKPHMFYDGILKRNIWVVVHHVASLQDRPERSSSNCLGNHNHNFGRRYRYAAYVNRKTKLPSCYKCKTHRLTMMTSTCNLEWQARKCSSCCDWSFDHALMYADMNSVQTFKWPRHFSTKPPPVPEHRKPSDEFICAPKEITYKWLTSAIKFATFNFHLSTHNKETGVKPISIGKRG